MISKCALALLAKGGETPVLVKRPRDGDARDKEQVVGGSGRGAQVLVGAKARVDDAVGGDVERDREKKCHKGDHCKKGHGYSKHGLNMDSDVGSAVGGGTADGAVPPTILSNEIAGPIIIEIGPQARWNLGDLQPLEAFGAFHLPQDSASYAGFTRDDIFRQSHRRLGMFIADYERLIHELDVELKSQIRAERDEEVKKLGRSMYVLQLDQSKDAEKVKMLEIEVKSLKESARKERGDSEGKIKGHVDELGRLRGLVDDLSKEKDRSESKSKVIRNEVVSLKEKLPESDAELLESLAAGYNACYDRPKRQGVDLSGHDFLAYRVEVRARMMVAGEGLRDGETPSVIKEV